MKNKKLAELTRNGLIAALYTVMGLVLAPIAFGPVQCRIPEALTLLPVLNPMAAVGVTLGCAITNLVGASTGANFLGMADVLLGSLTTLAAALLTARLGRFRWWGLPLLASLPPVLLNAVVIGWEWGYVTTGSLSPLAALPFMGLIGLGQLASCTVLGVLLVRAMEKTGIDKIMAPGGEH